MLLDKVELKTTERRCKLIKGCVVLHNLLLLFNDSCLVSGDDPELDQVADVVDDNTTDPELPVSHLQGLAKRDDIAAILAGRVQR